MVDKGYLIVLGRGRRATIGGGMRDNYLLAFLSKDALKRLRIVNAESPYSLPR